VPAWRFWLVVLTVVSMPLCFNVGYYLLAGRKPLFVSPLDVLIGPLVLLLLWDIRQGRVRALDLPWPNLVWAGLALASLAWAAGVSRGEWARSAVFQTTLVVFCAVWVFRHAVADVESHRRLALALGAVLGLCLLSALYQYLQPPGQPLPSGETDRYFGGGVTDVRVGGWYALRGQLAGQIAMFVPAAVAFAALDREPFVRGVAAVLAVLGVAVCLYGGGVVAAGAGVVAVAALLLVAPEGAPAGERAGNAGETARGWSLRRKGALVLAALLFVCVVLVPRLPRDNLRAIWSTLSPWIETEDGKTVVPSARLRRWQAAWNCLGHDAAWKTGVGAGGYQRAVNAFFDPRAYRRPSANTDEEEAFDREAHEPLTFGQLETTAVELGLPGVLAWACVLLVWALAAAAAFCRAEHPTARSLALAAFGAAVGAGVFCFFGSPLVRGVGGTFAFFMGLALALHSSGQREGRGA
jgi:hypothetical protein